MDASQYQVVVLRDVIEAQQKVITSWEEVFSSVEGTLINLVKMNIDLKVRLLREKNPDIEVPQNIYAEMDMLRTAYHSGNISPLAYFEGLDTLINRII